MAMDDKTLIAQYAAEEMVRINERLKDMITSEAPPPEEVRQSVIGDIETTLDRIKRALSQLDINPDDDKEETKQ